MLETDSIHNHFNINTNSLNVDKRAKVRTLLTDSIEVLSNHRIQMDKAHINDLTTDSIHSQGLVRIGNTVEIGGNTFTGNIIRADDKLTLGGLNQVNNIRVGIGTKFPSGRLEVQSQSGYSGGSRRILTLTHPDQSASPLFVNARSAGGGKLGITDGNNQTVCLRGTGSSYFDGGNLGVGTPNPASKLHVKKGNILVESSAGSGSDATIKFRNNNGNPGDKWRIAVDEDSNDKLYFLDDVNNVRRMCLLQNGKVGIGNVNPNALFHVNGGSSSDWGAIVKNQAGEGKGVLIEGGAGGGAGNEYNLLEVRRNPGAPGAQTIFAIQGKSGITYAKELKISLNAPIGDFVFKDNYELMSLGDLEKFVNRNHHLPNIPSQKEINEDNLNVGEMQAKQLQKIEELTLYTIEQQKQIDTLKKIVKEVKKQNKELKKKIETTSD